MGPASGGEHRPQQQPQALGVHAGHGVVGAAKLHRALGGPGDPVPGVDAEGLRLLLRAVFTAAGGTHDDWDTYDAVMANERRTAVLMTPERVYSNA